MDPVRGRRKTARKELTHLPREDRRKTLSEKLKKNQPKRVDFPPQMAEFLLTEHTSKIFEISVWVIGIVDSRKSLDASRRLRLRVFQSGLTWSG